ncbi:MAG TPA: substrate-binding domain-containing protein [Saprospiraceae bacterium]|nr:substrate-binding domain-containing protein [Saprospiraceae bacterium]
MKKAEEMKGPTMGHLDIIADESLKYIVEQEEEIFERTYKYAKLDISYMSEYDMFSQFLADSIDAIMTTRSLTKKEMDHFEQHEIYPRLTVYAKGAIAFVTNKNQIDTSYTYEEFTNMFTDSTKGKVFIIENAKSGITNVILQLIHQEKLPAHFYALGSKKEVFDYISNHTAAIGIIDWSDLSDSDDQMTKELLASVHLIGISRPVDSIQHGFVTPYQYNLQDSLYPFTRELYFISKTGMTDVGTGFSSFIAGEIGQKIILKAGLLPLYQSERLLEIRNTSDIKVIK